MNLNPKRVAMVIGSGSVKCAAALGLQRALVREGIGVDMVVGCSAGSIYATLIAAAIDIDVAIDMTKRMWTRDLTSVKNRRSLLRALMPRLFRFDEHFGLKDDRLILRRLAEAFGDMRIESTPTPLFIAATDFANGEQVVLSKGRVVDAIRASLAIPFIFEPYEIDGRLLIDGFMSDPLPVGVAMKERANIIVAIGFDSPYQSTVSSPARFGFQLSSIMANNLFKSNFAFHAMAHHGEVIPIIPQFKERIRLFDTEKIPYIIDEGERAAEEQMPYLRHLLDAAVAGAAG